MVHELSDRVLKNMQLAFIFLSTYIIASQSIQKVVSGSLYNTRVQLQLVLGADKQYYNRLRKHNIRNSGVVEA